MDFTVLSKAIKAAALNSNVGIQGLAQAEPGDVITITNMKTVVTGRNDVNEENPYIVLKAKGRNQELSTTANAMPNLRVVHSDQPESFDAAKYFTDNNIKFSTGVTQNAEFTFLKELIDAIDGDFDASKMELNCVGRLLVPSTNDPEKPAMSTQCYNGSAEYLATIRNITPGEDANAVFQSAREELHKSGIKAAFASKTPATDPKYFVWVPVFRFKMSA